MAQKRFVLKRKQKKQVAALSVIILAAAIAAIIMLTPAFNIQKITVMGNSVLDKKDIIQSSGIVTGVNIFGISTREAKKNIEEMGYVDGAKVKRRLPGTVEITIEEAVGVAKLSAKDGFLIITADGRAVELITDTKKQKDKQNDKQNVPVIKGLKNVKYKIGKKITSDDAEKLDTLFTCLREFSKNSVIFNMTQIDISQSSAVKFLYNGGKLTVNCGSVEKLDYKMECFSPILEQIGDNPEGYVDLERLIYRSKQ